MRITGEVSVLGQQPFLGSGVFPLEISSASLANDVDISRLRELANELGRDTIAEIIELFLGDTSVQISAMKIAIDCNDAISFRRAAHSLRGSCGNLGLNSLARICHEVEGYVVAESFAVGVDPTEGIDHMEYSFNRIRSAIPRLVRALAS